MLNVKKIEIIIIIARLIGLLRFFIDLATFDTGVLNYLSAGWKLRVPGGGWACLPPPGVARTPISI